MTNNLATQQTTSTWNYPTNKPSWFRELSLLTQWQMRRASALLPLYITVQLILSVATIIGYSLLVGDLGEEAKLYLLTGAPVISLVSLGFVMTPQMVMQSRVEGSFAWMQTLPLPRVVFLLADLTVWTIVALPGLVLSLVLGHWYFGIQLSISWLIVPSALLVAGIAAAVGYSIALVFPPPVPQLLSQVCVFVVMLFSPISFPAERLPQWAQSLHHWLPFEPMAQVIRSGLASDAFTTPLRSWIVLIMWACLAVGGASWALNKRP